MDGLRQDCTLLRGNRRFGILVQCNRSLLLGARWNCGARQEQGRPSARAGPGLVGGRDFLVLRMLGRHRGAPWSLVGTVVAVSTRNAAWAIRSVQNCGGRGGGQVFSPCCRQRVMPPVAGQECFLRCSKRAMRASMSRTIPRSSRMSPVSRWTCSRWSSGSTAGRCRCARLAISAS